MIYSSYKFAGTLDNDKEGHLLIMKLYGYFIQPNKLVKILCGPFIQNAY